MKQKRENRSITRDIERGKRGWANDQAMENPKETEGIEKEKQRNETDENKEKK